MWAVSLLVQPRDIETLRQVIRMDGLEVKEINEEIVLMSVKFSDSLDADEVYQLGSQAVQAINGLAKINLNFRLEQEIAVKSVVQLSGDGRVMKHLAHNDLRCEFTVRNKINCEDNQLNMPERWLRLAQNNENVAKVFRLVNYGLDNTVNAFRIYEVIENDITVDRIRALGFTNASLKRFRGTVNRPEASGDLARHGYYKGSPMSSEPMSTQEIGCFIYDMIYKWIHEALDKSNI